MKEELDVNFMPEFLTEKNWKDDFKNCDQWILGSTDPFLYEKTKRMFELAYNDGNGTIVNKEVIQCKPSEAEMIKYLKNVFLSVKVGFFNELESICSELDINYENVRCIATQDNQNRVGSHESTWDTMVIVGLVELVFQKIQMHLLTLQRKRN